MIWWYTFNVINNISLEVILFKWFWWPCCQLDTTKPMCPNWYADKNLLQRSSCPKNHSKYLISPSKYGQKFINILQMAKVHMVFTCELSSVKQSHAAHKHKHLELKKEMQGILIKKNCPAWKKSAPLFWSDLMVGWVL